MQNVRLTLQTVGLAGLAVGFWMAWPPLGVIVPSAIVFTVAFVSDVVERGRADG